MDRQSAKRLPSTAYYALFLLSCALLVASDQGLPPEECDPEDVSKCYANYLTILWRPKGDAAGEGEVTNEDIAKRCSEIKAKVECHQRIAGCPEEVRRNFTRRERGYEAVRDLFCNEAAARDYYTAVRCQDGEKFVQCHDKQMEGITPENTKDPTCKLSQANIECYETAFSSNCGLSLKSAKAALLKGEEAVLLLADCNGTISSFLASGQLLIAAVAVVLLRWSSLSCF
uniref:Putative secreted protein n=1 Tax=Amblyomma triste TaxID=251400 RepID=A0A023G1W6_AMBTT